MSHRLVKQLALVRHRAGGGANTYRVADLESWWFEHIHSSVYILLICREMDTIGQKRAKQLCGLRNILDEDAIKYHYTLSVSMEMQIRKSKNDLSQKGRLV